ncbi:hypothetical protein AGMMS49959_02120 [Planctomycetales bacterium]|nr:hypothetical protein AGMMS49959_02120 [Planctomycetales bacterium]
MSCLTLSLPRQLHREEKSTVTVGLLLLTATLYLCVAGVWNTGSLVEQKIRTQAVADAAALSAASQMASAANEMIMLNMMHLRYECGGFVSAAAMVTIGACAGQFIAIPLYLGARIAASAGLDLAAVTSLTAELTLIAIDVVRLIAWGIHIGVGMGHYVAFTGLYYHPYILAGQQNLPRNTGDYINRQLKEAENVANESGDVLAPATEQAFNIYAYSPTVSSGLLYPNANASLDKMFTTKPWTNPLLLVLRTFGADGQWAVVEDKDFKPPYIELPGPKRSFSILDKSILPALRKPKFFDGFKSGTVWGVIKTATTLKLAWYLSLAMSCFIGSAVNIGEPLGYVVSHPTDKKTQQVIVLVEKHDSDATFMARGFFQPALPGKSILAMAQAEIYNPHTGLFSELTGTSAADEIVSNVFPWMDFSSLGANYEARLRQIDHTLVGRFLATGNPEIRRIKDENGLGNVGDKDVFLH